MHEPLEEREAARRPPERSFGITFAVVFAIVAILPLLHGRPVRLWSLAVAVVFLAAGLFFPGLLRPLNSVWFRFGELLHRIVSPVVLGLLFFVAITPMAVLLRLAGHQLLNRKYDRTAKSYWIARHPPGPAPETIRNQF